MTPLEAAPIAWPWIGLTVIVLGILCYIPYLLGRQLRLVAAAWGPTLRNPETSLRTRLQHRWAQAWTILTALATAGVLLPYLYLLLVRPLAPPVSDEQERAIKDALASPQAVLSRLIYGEVFVRVSETEAGVVAEVLDPARVSAETAGEAVR